MELYQMNGLSRISPTDEPMYMNGLSRINHLNGYTLNGYTLNAYALNGTGRRRMTPDQSEDFMCYLEECAMMNAQPSPIEFRDYMMQGRAERQARRDARRARRAERKSRRSRRQEARTERSEARAERAREGEGFFQKLGGAAEGLASRALDLGGDYLDAGMDEFGAEFDLLPPVTVTANRDRGYLIGKPPFEPWTGRWWQSSRVPMWQKAAIGAGALVAVDQIALKGKFTNPLLGKKARR